MVDIRKGFECAILILSHLLVPFPSGRHLSLIVNGDVVIVVLVQFFLGVGGGADLGDTPLVFLLDQITLTSHGSAEEYGGNSSEQKIKLHI